MSLDGSGRSSGNADARLVENCVGQAARSTERAVVIVLVRAMRRWSRRVLSLALGVGDLFAPVLVGMELVMQSGQNDQPSDRQGKPHKPGWEPTQHHVTRIANRLS